MSHQTKTPDAAAAMERMRAIAASAEDVVLEGPYEERVLQFHAARACGLSVSGGDDDFKWGDKMDPPAAWQRFVNGESQAEHEKSPVGVETKAPRRTKRRARRHHKFGMLLKACAVKTQGRRLCFWLAGPAGSGKTTLAMQVAEELKLPFYSIGAVTSDFRLVGFTDAKGKTVRTPFREAYEHGGVFLFDEIDGSHPAALVALNQALSNNSFSFPDGMITRHKDFVCIAAANTYGHGASAEYVGRTKIDAATLDRFIKMEIGYDERLERSLAGTANKNWVSRVQKIRAAVRELGVKVIVSPRATIHGIALLQAGWDPASIEDAVIFSGIDKQTRQKILKAAR